MTETAAHPSLTLYGHWRSSCSQRVQIGLRLKAVPFCYVPIDLARRQQESEAFRALHPGAQVPVLVAGDLVLSQSLAILEWLEETFPHRGCPCCPPIPWNGFGPGRLASLWPPACSPSSCLAPPAAAGSLASPPAGRPWAARARAAPRMGGEGPGGPAHGQAAEALCAAFSRAHLEALMPELQRLVGRTVGPFCLGAAPSLADCCVVPQLEAAARLGVDVNRWPALSLLMERTREWPAFQESEPLRQRDAPTLQAPTALAATLSSPGMDPPPVAADGLRATAPGPEGPKLLGSLQALAGKEPADPLRRYLLDQANSPIPQLEWVRGQTALHFPALTSKVSAFEICLLLRWLTHLLQPRLALEVGVFSGCSSLAIASALPLGGRLIGFDIAPGPTAIARQAWARAELAERVELRMEDAALGLPRLAAEGLQESVDLAYVDGCNCQYQQNLDDLLPLMRPGGLVVFDNTLWKGQVADPSSSDAQAAHLRQLNGRLRNDPALISCVLSLGDGVSLAIKRTGA